MDCLEDSINTPEKPEDAFNDDSGDSTTSQEVNFSLIQCVGNTIWEIFTPSLH